MRQLKVCDHCSERFARFKKSLKNRTLHLDLWYDCFEYRNSLWDNLNGIPNTPIGHGQIERSESDVK